MNAKVAVLEDRAIIAVAGPDAGTFLHNVVTADIAALAEGEAAYTALLTPQGKILFDFFVLNTGAAYLIDCAREQTAGLVQRLTIYKLRADVTIAPDADAKVYAIWDGPPPRGVPAYADPRCADMGYRASGQLEATSGIDDYTAHRIALGIADTMRDIGSGEVFPHEANLDQLGGISFTKGCYVGQEVVSRMQHRGTARTRFVIATAAGGLDPGAEVVAAGRRIGEIKSVAGHQALALLRIDRAANAIAAGEAITAAGSEVTLEVPDWAKFTLVRQQED